MTQPTRYQQTATVADCIVVLPSPMGRDAAFGYVKGMVEGPNLHVSLFEVSGDGPGGSLRSIVRFAVSYRAVSANRNDIYKRLVDRLWNVDAMTIPKRAIITDKVAV